MPFATTGRRSVRGIQNARLAEQTPAHARDANTLLLTTFTDILASLIGEQLTASILRSAWGIPASDKSGKELDNG